jgi:hypothetical protein
VNTVELPFFLIDDRKIFVIIISPANPGFSLGLSRGHDLFFFSGRLPAVLLH